MQKLYVNNKKVINPNFKGINMIHQMYEYIPDKFDRIYNAEQLDLEFDTIKKMRVKMIRSFYGASLAWDNEKKEYNFNTPHMQGFIKACKRFKEIGVEVGITPHWSMRGLLNPPIEGHIDNSVNIIRFGDSVADDVEATAKNFEKFIELSVKEFEKQGLDNIKYLFAFTECNNSFNGSDKELKAEKKYLSVVSRDYTRLLPIFDRFITAVHNGLVAAGKRDKYKIVAPCDNWRADDGSEPFSILTKYCCDNLADKVDIIGSHNGYDRSFAFTDDTYYDIPFIRMPEPLGRAQKVQKGLWIDEYNVMIHGCYTADKYKVVNPDPMKGVALGAMVNSIMNMGADNVFLWGLYDQQWPDHTNAGEFDDGVQMVGYIPCLMRSTTPYASWYSLSLITRYLQDGEVYESQVTKGTYISALKRTDGETTLVVTNYIDEPTDIEIDFEESFGGKTFYKYIYDPKTVEPKPGNEMIGCSGAVGDIETKITDKLPGYAMVIYTTEKPE